jgi:hypothetical protein
MTLIKPLLSATPIFLFATFLLTAIPRVAAAQAWVPEKGEGSINFSWQNISNTGHRLSDGFLAKGGQSTNIGLYIDADYALTDRLSFGVGIPYVFGKYDAPNPPPPPIPFLPVDQCHCWNSGWQDFNVTVRYNIVNENFALTPSVSFGLPSHDYEFRGEAVLGRNLKETRLAIDAGKRLDFISPRLSVQGSYAYAFVQRPLGLKNDRSNMKLQAGYVLTRRLFVQGLSLWQRTHGGLRFGSPTLPDLPPPGEVNTPERLDEHDRLLRDNNWRFGGGATYSFEKVDLFGTYVHYATGTDAHAGGALTAGVSIPFSLRSN